MQISFKDQQGIGDLKSWDFFSWINHHIEQKHFSPTLLITLSSAAYFWPGVKHIIQGQLTITKDDLLDLDNNYVQIVNDNAIIIQGMFQKGVQIWFNTIGKITFSFDITEVDLTFL
jgi:hypothetical protein